MNASGIDIIVFIVIIAAIIFLIRLFGAWMLRINELISLQQEILRELKKLNAHKE
jgi:purine-cytosine permease-like protein